MKLFSRTTSLYPSKSAEILILLGFILFISAEIFRKYYFNFDTLAIEIEQSKLEWYIRIVRDIGITTFVASMIIFGIRAIRFYGHTFRRYILPIIGVILTIMLAISSYFVYEKLSELEHQMNTSKYLLKIKEKLDEDNFSIKVKSNLSKLYAHEYYITYGKNMTYFDKNGEKVLYSSSKEDIELRNKMMYSRKLFSWSKKALERSIYLWSAVLFISLLLGFFTSIKKDLENI